MASESDIDMPLGDAVINIPMVPTNKSYNEKSKDVTITTTEMSRSSTSVARPNLGRRGTTDGPDPTIHDDELTKLGQIYDKVIGISPIVRWSVYILPMAALLAIPLILFDTVYKDKKADGVRLLGLFIWIEVAWISLWAAKLLAISTFYVFQVVGGLISSGIRKYSLMLKALETPISLFIWAILAFATHRLVYVFNDNTSTASIPLSSTITVSKHVSVDQTPWIVTFQRVLRANIATTAILLIEKTLIQMIAVGYNRKQLYSKIRENKRTGHVLDMMYEASSKKYPAYTRPDLMDLDVNIHENTKIEGRSTRMAMFTLKRFGDGVASAFGNMASEITGRQVFKPTATHHIVNSALERRESAEALGERVWRTFIADSGSDAFTEQDLIDELGKDRIEDARYIFAALDRDHNGDISLEEMVLFTDQVHQDRKNMYKGYQNVKEALKVLDNVLSVVVLIIITLIYAAFFSSYLAKNYYTIWTTFTGLSFMLGATAAELFGSCILVFIKHPYDIGDRVTITSTELVVDKISLLYTEFRRVDNNAMVQIPNNINNANWIDNITKSKAMKERLTFSVNAGTSFADIEILRKEMEAFVQEPENRRDYQPEIEIELMSTGDLSKLDLRVELQHKSNWSNEKLRAYRRSKFNCALLSAMRKIPIDGTGGCGPGAGSIANPNYSVTITRDEAEVSKAHFNAEKDAKRLIPKNATVLAPESIGMAVSSGLDLLPSLVNRKGSVAA